MRLLAALACFIIGALYVVPSSMALAAEFAGERFAPLWALLVVAGAGLGWWLACLLLLLKEKPDGR